MKRIPDNLETIDDPNVKVIERIIEKNGNGYTALTKMVFGVALVAAGGAVIALMVRQAALEQHVADLTRDNLCLAKPAVRGPDECAGIRAVWEERYVTTH